MTQQGKPGLSAKKRGQQDAIGMQVLQFQTRGVAFGDLVARRGSVFCAGFGCGQLQAKLCTEIVADRLGCLELGTRSLRWNQNLGVPLWFRLS